MAYVIFDRLNSSFKVKAQEVLDQVRLKEEMTRERLCQVARTALRTKVHSELADKLTEVCVDAVLAIREEGKPLDLHMVEIMDMQVSAVCDQST